MKYVFGPVLTVILTVVGNLVEVVDPAEPSGWFGRFVLLMAVVSGWISLFRAFRGIMWMWYFSMPSLVLLSAKFALVLLEQAAETFESIGLGSTAAYDGVTSADSILRSLLLFSLPLSLVSLVAVSIFRSGLPSYQARGFYNQVGIRWLNTLSCNEIVHVQTWYPCLRGNSHRPALMSPNQVDLLMKSAEQPGWVRALHSHLPLMRAPGFLNAALQEPKEGGRYPVIIFSHGLYGYPEVYSLLCSMFARFGYVVLSLEHSDGSTPGNTLRGVGTLTRVFLPYKAVSDPSISFPRRKEHEFRNGQLQTRVADVEAVLAMIHSLDRNAVSPLRGRLDLNRVILAGHSFGGVTSIAAAYMSDVAERFKVRGLVGLDPWMFPMMGQPSWRDDLRGLDSSQSSVPPALLLTSTDWSEAEANSKRMANFEEASAGAVTFMAVQGAGHHSWNDTSLYSPSLAHLLGLSGSLDTVRVHQATVELIHAFCQHCFSLEGSARAHPFTVPSSLVSTYPFLKNLSVSQKIE